MSYPDAGLGLSLIAGVVMHPIASKLKAPSNKNERIERCIVTSLLLISDGVVRTPGFENG
jgi:flagellar motor component MotA